MGNHHAHGSFELWIVTQPLDVEEQPIGIRLQRGVLVEQPRVNSPLTSPLAELKSRQLCLFDGPLDSLFITPLLEFFSQIIECWGRVAMPDRAALISAADRLTEQVVEQGRVRIRTVPDHVAGQILEESDLVLTGCRRSRSQVPRIEGYASRSGERRVGKEG